MRIEMELKGVKKAIKRVNRFETEKINEIKRIVAKYAELIQSQAQALAPVGQFDGGNLKNSITVNYYRGGLAAEIVVGAEYAIYVEYGTGIYAKEGNGRKTPWVYYSEELGRYVWTRGMRAQPFFYPAVETHRDDIIRDMNRI